MVEKMNIDGWGGAFNTKQLHIAQEKAASVSRLREANRKQAINSAEISGHKFYAKFMEFGNELYADFRFTNVTNVLEKTKLINR
jgi:hypothetical protein